MQQDAIEQMKFMADFLKHITTLSTGALVLLTVFLEKLARKPRSKELIVVALCGFTLSLLASVFAFIGLLHDLPMLPGNPVIGSGLWNAGGIVTSGGFIIGVLSLTGFGIRNLNTSTESASPPSATQE